jgi:cytochrome c oxidase subunit 3
MTTQTFDPAVYRRKVSNLRMGLWLFILSDSFMFIGLIVTRFYLMGDRRPELNQPLGLLVSAVLLVSSFFMNRAEVHGAHGNAKGFIRNALVTMTLGIIFLAGVIGVEWRSAPFGPADGVQGAVFYMMTGMHAFHVLTGVIFVAIVIRNSSRGLYTAEKHWPLEAAANYWHFVDVVWQFFYPALYLIGTVAIK